MRALLVASNWTETLGHAVRSIAVAQSLARLGHEAAFIGFPSYRKWLPPETAFYSCEPLPHKNGREIFFSSYTYEDVVYYSGHSMEAHIRKTVEREREVIRAFQPDIIFNDEQFTIGISAALEQVPVVSLATWPLHPLFNLDKEREFPERRSVLIRSRNCWNRVLRGYKLDPIGHLSELLFDRSDGLIAPTSPLLEPELMQADPRVHYVGALEPSGMFEQEPDWLQQMNDERPLIFIYLSSLQFPGGINTPNSFKKLYAGLEGQPYRAIFALGAFNREPHGLPARSPDGGIRLESFVPGTALMKHAQLAIFPATHSMMLSAIRHHVPSLLLPDMFEREYNAACMTRVGLGQMLPLSSMPTERIRDACDSLLRMKRPLPAAYRVQQDLLARGGPDRVVERMISCLRKRRGEHIS